jgi:hypothetical protein
VGDVLPEILPPELFDPIIDPKDIGYTHPVFVQCFLDSRILPAAAAIYADLQRSNMRSSASVSTGLLRASFVATNDRRGARQFCDS